MHSNNHPDGPPLPEGENVLGIERQRLPKHWAIVKGQLKAAARNRYVFPAKKLVLPDSIVYESDPTRYSQYLMTGNLPLLANMFAMEAYNNPAVVGAYFAASRARAANETSDFSPREATIHFPGTFLLSTMISPMKTALKDASLKNPIRSFVSLVCGFSNTVVNIVTTSFEACFRAFYTAIVGNLVRNNYPRLAYGFAFLLSPFLYVANTLSHIRAVASSIICLPQSIAYKISDWFNGVAGTDKAEYEKKCASISHCFSCLLRNLPSLALDAAVVAGCVFFPPLLYALPALTAARNAVDYATDAVISRFYDAVKWVDDKLSVITSPFRALFHKIDTLTQRKQAPREIELAEVKPRESTRLLSRLFRNNTPSVAAIENKSLIQPLLSRELSSHPVIPTPVAAPEAAVVPAAQPLVVPAVPENVPVVVPPLVDAPVAPVVPEIVPVVVAPAPAPLSSPASNGLFAVEDHKADVVPVPVIPTPQPVLRRPSLFARRAEETKSSRPPQIAAIARPIIPKRVKLLANEIYLCRVPALKDYWFREVADANGGILLHCGNLPRCNGNEPSPEMLQCVKAQIEEMDKQFGVGNYVMNIMTTDPLLRLAYQVVCKANRINYAPLESTVVDTLLQKSELNRAAKSHIESEVITSSSMSRANQNIASEFERLQVGLEEDLRAYREMANPDPHKLNNNKTLLKGFLGAYISDEETGKIIKYLCRIEEALGVALEGEQQLRDNFRH